MTANKLLQVAEHVRRIMTPDVCGSRIQFGRCAVRQIVDCLGSLASGGPNRASSASQLGRCTVCQIVDCLGSLASGGPNGASSASQRVCRLIPGFIQLLTCGPSQISHLVNRSR